MNQVLKYIYSEVNVSFNQMSFNQTRVNCQDPEECLSSVFLHNAQKYGHDKVAIREKGYGIWQSYSWQDYLDQVKDLALGLATKRAAGSVPGRGLARGRPGELPARRCAGPVSCVTHPDLSPTVLPEGPGYAGPATAPWGSPRSNPPEC